MWKMSVESTQTRYGALKMAMKRLRRRIFLIRPILSSLFSSQVDLRAERWALVAVI
jgi:hypothetical protein